MTRTQARNFLPWVILLAMAGCHGVPVTSPTAPTQTIGGVQGELSVVGKGVEQAATDIDAAVTAGQQQTTDRPALDALWQKLAGVAGLLHSYKPTLDEQQKKLTAASGQATGLQGQLTAAITRAQEAERKNNSPMLWAMGLVCGLCGLMIVGGVYVVVATAAKVKGVGLVAAGIAGIVVSLSVEALRPFMPYVAAAMIVLAIALVVIWLIRHNWKLEALVETVNTNAAMLGSAPVAGTGPPVVPVLGSAYPLPVTPTPTTP